MDFFKEIVNIVKEGEYYLVQRKKFGIMKYLGTYCEWYYDIECACRVLSIEDAEMNYKIYLNKRYPQSLEKVKKLK